MSDELQRWMGRVETKIDTILESNKDHGDRITSLENDRNKAKGAIIGVSVFSGGVGALIAKIVGIH